MVGARCCNNRESKEKYVRGACDNLRTRYTQNSSEINRSRKPALRNDWIFEEPRKKKVGIRSVQLVAQNSGWDDFFWGFYMSFGRKTKSSRQLEVQDPHETRFFSNLGLDEATSSNIPRILDEVTSSNPILENHKGFFNEENIRNKIGKYFIFFIFLFYR